MHDLDNPDTFPQIDRSSLRDRIRSLPGQCEAAWAQVQQCGLQQPQELIGHVVLAGMGGSAIAGDLVRDLGSHQGSVPITIVRGFQLPFRLDKSSLFIACSYSGNTSETLSLFRSAVESEAQVFAVAGGGTLAQEAQLQGLSLLEIKVSSEPRTAAAYNFMLLLGLLDRLGVVNTKNKDVVEALSSLSRKVGELEDQSPTKNNLGKQLAQAVLDKLVLVYSGGLFTGMAHRWKSQFNENAKTWAFADAIPELLHNSVEAWVTPRATEEEKVALLLRSTLDDPVLLDRYSIAEALLQRSNIGHRIVETDGATPLTQILNMLLLGDYVSYYLAILKGVDPSPTPAITAGKEMLGSGQ